MKKFCKVLAILLAVLMLATMATACKEEDEDDFGTVETNSRTGKNNDNSGSSEGDNGENGDANTENGSGTGTENGGSNNNSESGSGNGSGNSSTATSSDTNAGANEQKQKEKEKNYDETKKYSAENNPLVAESKTPNSGVQPSFDIDTTGFVKNNIKIADLKGKKLTLLTSINYGTFQYKGPKGENLSEYDWFDAMKSTYGLNLTYIKSSFSQAPNTIMAYMNAGKALDLVQTHVSGFPQYLCLSQSVEPYLNLQNMGNSPGVDKMTLEETKWCGEARCISPIGTVNVIWYNKSLVEEFRLKDPHETWKQGNWNWDTWKSFLQSIPTQTSSGETLYAYGQCNTDALYSWPLTNGVAPVAIDSSKKTPALINNWKNDKVRDAWNFYATTCKSVKYDLTSSNHNGDARWNDLWSGKLMMHDAYHLMDNKETNEYAKTHKYDWVPYPKSTSGTGRDVAFNYGYTLIIPKKVKTQSNIPYSVKFAELWANRFTEAMFDYLATSEWLKFNYARRKEYFEFVVKNTYFGLQMNDWHMLTGDDYDALTTFRSSLELDRLNVLTEATRVENLVQKAIDFCLTYGS